MNAKLSTILALGAAIGGMTSVAQEEAEVTAPPAETPIPTAEGEPSDNKPPKTAAEVPA